MYRDNPNQGFNQEILDLAHYRQEAEQYHQDKPNGKHDHQ